MTTSVKISSKELKSAVKSLNIVLKDNKNKEAKECELIIDKDESKIIKEIFNLSIEWKSNEEISRIISSKWYKTKFEKMKKEGNNKIELVLDFKGVEYTSSAGLRTILYTKKKIDSMAEGSKFEIINISPEIMEVFDMTGFSDFLSLNGSEN